MYWGWIVVGLMAFFIVGSLAEICSAYPVSGKSKSSRSRRRRRRRERGRRNKEREPAEEGVTDSISSWGIQSTSSLLSSPCFAYRSFALRYNYQQLLPLL